MTHNGFESYRVAIESYHVTIETHVLDADTLEEGEDLAAGFGFGFAFGARASACSLFFSNISWTDRISSISNVKNLIT